MNGNTEYDDWQAIELAREADFALGSMTVRPSASEIVVDGMARRVEPRVMQVLIALVQANQTVVSRSELMARCWSGTIVGEDAVTRAVGQVRRLSRWAPGAFAVQTIPKIGYRLIPSAELSARTAAAGDRVFGWKARHAKRAALMAATLLAGVVGVSALRPPDSVPATTEFAEPRARLGTNRPEAAELHLLATNLLEAGGRDNTLRAETLLRDALEIDPHFHSAKEALVIALMSAATFTPTRAAAAYKEAADILDSEVVDTPLAWRGHLLRGFHRVLVGDWMGAQRALTRARETAPQPAPPPVEALETFLLGSVGRLSDSLELVQRQSMREPLSRDRSRALQQWLNRTGHLAEAEREYARSRDLPGDRSSIELAALIRALGTRDAGMIGERHDRYRKTDWGRPGDEALGAVANDPQAALALLREQIRAWNTPGAMPPFRAAAWALGAIFAARPARTITSVGQR